MGSNKNKKRYAGIARKSIDSKWKKNAFKSKRKLGQCKTTTKKPKNFNKQKNTARNLMMKELKERLDTMKTE